MASKNNARALIMDLLYAAPETAITTRQFMLAAGLFAISENSMRVALTRLASEGLIAATARGVYQLTAQAKSISEPVAHRVRGARATKPWSGSYLAVQTGALGRVDRTALVRRERTLRLHGFRELSPDLFIRPDNLAEPVKQTHERLLATGLDARAVMFVASHFDAAHSTAISHLWDTAALNHRYQSISLQVQTWLATTAHLAVDVAARESLLIGRQAIPLMLSDPLLPAPLVDVALQQQFFNDVQQLDQIGHQLWQQLYQQSLLQGKPAQTSLS
jgi:phenylacetic acid degradation operon negative regulatory protein